MSCYRFMKERFREARRLPFKVGIIADDLAGNHDSAAQFARKASLRLRHMIFLQTR